MKWSAGQRYLAEFLGTFGLLVSITGAVLFSFNLGTVDAASRVLLASLSLGLGVMGLAYAFGDVSGGHFNPAITIGMWLAGRTSLTDAIAYILSQVLGGIVGVAAMAGVAYGSAPLWSTVSGHGLAFASQGYSGGGSPYQVALGSVFLLEVVLTFLLVLTALFATRAEGFAKNLAPVGIAFVLAMTNLIAIPIDGASVNPARSFAPAILSAGLHGDAWAIHQDWLFWVAPILGGILAAIVEWCFRPRVA